MKLDVVIGAGVLAVANLVSRLADPTPAIVGITLAIATAMLVVGEDVLERWWEADHEPPLPRRAPRRPTRVVGANTHAPRATNTPVALAPARLLRRQ